MIKHNEIVDIEAGNPFGQCQLDRKKYADVLTTIVSTYADGFVLAINNKWGTGKTTFIRMWERDLKDKGFKTVLFNAWENDFENNALTALMGELKTLTKAETEQRFKEVLKNGAILSKNILPALIGAVSEKYIGKDIKELAEKITKGVTDIFENDVNEYANKKKSIKDFRDSLSKFIADTWDGKPVVFIIDELDRCRPDYAVSILEQIKHFFSIPQIVFVLSIDKEQLGHAVRGVYGSEFIDADEYLRRFIDIEYSIPEPDIDKYVKYLFEYYKFDEFFRKPNRVTIHNQSYSFKTEREDFLKVSSILFKQSKLTLRQQEKIFSNARLSLKSFGYNYYLFPQLFLFLIFVRNLNFELFKKIRNKEITLLELQKQFKNYIKSNITEEDSRYLIYMESYLIHFYNSYLETYEFKNPLYKRNIETNEDELLFKSLIDNSIKQSDFLSYLVNMHRETRLSGDHLDNVLNKIDLLDGFKE